MKPSILNLTSPNANRLLEQNTTNILFITQKDIRVCSGNDLSLALMAADYYAENGESANDFIEIMDRRCDCLPPDKQEVRKILGSLSIIDIAEFRKKVPATTNMFNSDK